MNSPFLLYPILTSISLASALSLHLIPRLGDAGREWSDRLGRAPAIDWVLAYFTLLPPVIAFALDRWSGVAIALAAQISALWGWIWFHEFIHRQRDPGKIHRTTGCLVGAWRNHLAAWITAIVIPVFWFIRLAEIFVYPSLTWLLGFPKYTAGDWVNVSRQKFDGLIGYDLIWCLYCDWMTGVWSLGSEMLRNVESFWCPIRFYPDKKCANCQIDFPDIAGGWVPANGTIEDVEKVLLQKYSSDGDRSWFGHPDRPENREIPAETTGNGHGSDVISDSPREGSIELK
ncbi:hypothetical protein V0288_20965 [Pannus brasiliensis CCIBt3594]|uniref:Uncharacterized protein n=1 Tax=Pannus brasiliensis CCIBt3594 TaxID=1427578 RepID=A0AAW9QYW6_9CHRO